MNELEHAVIEAARLVANEASNLDVWAHQLRRAVVALDEYERAQQEAGIAEVEWAHVAEGDFLRGNSGKFYPVLSAKREWSMGKATGKFLITVKVGPSARTLKRGADDGKATVRRGAAGAAVDIITEVLSSGEKES